MDAPDRIEVRTKSDLIVEWPDGERSVIIARVLRAACACATCHNEDGGALRAANRPVAVTIESASLVGAYGINLEFGPDGHRTGIFDWVTLRALAQASPDA